MNDPSASASLKACLVPASNVPLELFRLQGWLFSSLLCLKVSPPKLSESLDNLDHLLQLAPGDMHAVSTVAG